MNNKLQVIILCGIPSSGKSTFANKWVKEDPSNRVIISKDSIRSSFGVYWVPNREKLVEDLEILTIRLALINKFNIVLDSTNLNKKHVNKVKKVISDFENVEITFKDFEISLWKAIFRSYKRWIFGGKFVSYKVIKNFYDRYKK